MNGDNRYELKFVLDQGKLSNAFQWMYQSTMLRRTYSPRWVNSIYFDDVTFRSVRDNLTGLPERRKIRLRWYHDSDVNHISAPVLEVKQRQGRVGNKLRFAVPAIQASLLSLPVGKIMKRIEQELSATQAVEVVSREPIVPVLHVCYRRQYFESPDGLRVTFDQPIEHSLVVPHQPLRSMAAASYPLTVMELKFPIHMKDRISKHLASLSLVARRHSKYLAGLATFGLTTYV